MRKIKLYSFRDFNFEIDTDSHQVSDPRRAKNRYIPFVIIVKLFITFIKFIIMPLIIIIISMAMCFAVIMLIIITIDYITTNLGIKSNKIINAFIAGGIAGIAYGLFNAFGKKIMSYISEYIAENKIIFFEIINILRQWFWRNLLTPESILKYYLICIANGLYKNAYGLLTDQAQSLGRVNLPKETPIQNKMPDLVIEDFNSFKNFWKNIQFNWTVLTERFENKKYEEILSHSGLNYSNVAILQVKIKAENDTFLSKFILVQRHGIWFLANGFFWPS